MQDTELLAKYITDITRTLEQSASWVIMGLVVTEICRCSEKARFSSKRTRSRIEAESLLRSSLYPVPVYQSKPEGMMITSRSSR